MDLNPKESNLETYLRSECRTLGWTVIKCGYDGWPDNTVVADFGVQGWIELKRWGEEPEPKQALRIEHLIERGVLVDWANTKAGVNRFLVRMRERVRTMRSLKTRGLL